MRRNGTLRPQGEPTPGVDGWLLDKFKFLPMVERAWAAKPAKAFYFFEADTYVFWDNLFHLLQTLDPDAPLYLGSPSSGRRDEKRDLTTFANGGPGFVLSRGAMQQLLHRERAPSGLFVDPSLSERWLPLVAGECCGDSVLGWALSRAGVALQGLWPLFNPHPLRGIPYGSAHWCQPVVTLHKTEAEDMVNLWKWEFEHRTLHRPLLYADLWHFLRTGQTETLQDWDNGNYDSWNAPPAAEIASVEACRAYCRSHGDCLQWNFKASDDVNECMLMRSIRLGRAADHQAVDADATKPHAAVKTTSGWITDRIASWVDASEYNQIQWVSPSVQRIF